MTRGNPTPYPVYVDRDGVRRKHCPQCGEERSIDAGEFTRRFNTWGTTPQFEYRCRECKNAAARKRRRDHRDEVLAVERASRSRDRRRGNYDAVARWLKRQT